MVSVIVPVYNVEKYLPACIESVINQTYSEWELLLVDDGSTDNSGKICDEYAQKDKRIKVFHKENGGVSSARNLGLDNMEGNFCITLDSDDLIHPKLLEDAVKIVMDTQSDVVIFGYEKVNEDFSFIYNHQTPNKIEFDILSTDEVINEILIGGRFRMLACNKLYRKELWENIRYPIGRKYGDDTSVTYQLMSRCSKAAYISNTYYYYRNVENSALHTEISEQNLQLFDSYSEMLDFFHSTNPKFDNLASQAYVVRIFDFFSRLKDSSIEDVKKKYILFELNFRCKNHKRQLVFSKNATIKQRMLLGLFFLSKSLFWKVYQKLF